MFFFLILTSTTMCSYNTFCSVFRSVFFLIGNKVIFFKENEETTSTLEATPNKAKGVVIRALMHYTKTHYNQTIQIHL